MNETLVFTMIIVLGIISALLIIANAMVTAKRDSKQIALLAPFLDLAKLGFEKADTALVPYGSTLKPINELATAAETLVDEPTDFVNQMTPDYIEAALKKLINLVEELTDGKPMVVEGESPAPNTEAMPK